MELRIVHSDRLCQKLSKLFQTVVMSIGDSRVVLHSTMNNQPSGYTLHLFRRQQPAFELHVKRCFLVGKYTLLIRCLLACRLLGYTNCSCTSIFSYILAITC